MIERMTASLGGGGDARQDASGEKFASAIAQLPLAGMAIAAELVGLLASAHARELQHLSETAPADDPRLDLMLRKSVHATAAAAGLAFERTRLEKIAEPAPEGGFLLHGHVLTASDGPAAATLSVLESGKPAHDFTNAKTDATGYFRFLSLAPAKSAPVSQKAETAAPAKDAKDSPAPANGRTLELKIVDDRGHEIAPREEIILHSGVAVYRTLILYEQRSKRSESSD